MRAYLYVPFQQGAATLGKLSAKHQEYVALNSVPPDLPTNWYRESNFRMYLGFWVEDQILAIGLTEKGEPDHEGRDNPLSHMIASDEPSFLINPISSLVALSKTLQSGDAVNQSTLDSIVDSSHRYIDNEESWKTWMKTIDGFGSEFILEAVSSLFKNPVTYVFYDKKKPMDFFNYIRLAYMIAGPWLGKKLSFVSTIDDVSENAWTLIRGYPIVEDEPSKDTRNQIKKHKAGMVNLRKKEMESKGKILKSVSVLMNELANEPWFGMNRLQHLITIRKLLEERTSREVSETMERMNGIYVLKEE